MELVSEVVESGEPIVITKRGRAVAQLAPLRLESAEDWRGAMRECGEIRGDLVKAASELREWQALRG